MLVEEEHQSVLQGIEVVVANLYRRHPELTDHMVLRTYEALTQVYSAEVTGRTAKPIVASGVEAELVHDVRSTCDWLLGRSGGQSGEGGAAGLDPLDVPTLVLCLKRLVKSVKTWNKHGGRRGYLNFMSPYTG